MPTNQEVRSNEERRREHRAARQRQQRMRRRIFYISLCLFVVILGIVLSLTVFFKVSKYEAKGETIYTEDEIVLASGVKSGDNLFLLKESEINKQITEKLPFVGSVKIKVSLPDKLVITATETSVKAAVAYKDGFILIDENGKVLGQVKTLEEVYKDIEAAKIAEEKSAAEKAEEEKKAAETKAAEKKSAETKAEQKKAEEKKADAKKVDAKKEEPSKDKKAAGETKPSEKTKPTESAKPSEKAKTVDKSSQAKPTKEQPKYVVGTSKIMIIKGFKVKSAEIGKPLSVSNEKAFSLYAKLMAELKKNNITDITEIDLSDTVNITIMYQDRIQLLVGSVSNLEKKIALAQNVLKNQNEISPYQKGTVDLSIDKKAYFSPTPESTAAPKSTQAPTEENKNEKTDVTKNSN